MTPFKNSASVSIATIGNISAPLVGFISAPILAHGLGVDGRGALGAALAPLLLAVNMVTLGLPEAVTYYTARNPRLVSWILKRSSLILIAFGLLALISVWLISPALAPGNGQLQALIVWAGFAIVPGLLVALLRSVAQGLHRWWLITSERLVSSILRLAWLSLLFSSGSLNLASAVIAMSVTTFAGGLVYVFLLRDRQQLINRGNEASPRLLSYGMRMWAGALTGILLSRLNQVLMVPLSGTSELGLFVVAASVAEVVLVFNGAVRDVTFASEARESELASLATSARISTVVTLAASFVLGVVSIWALPWLFGEAFAPAVLPLWILLAANVLGNPGSIAGAGLSGRGRPGARSWSMGVALILNFAALVVLVPQMGATGAALAAVLSSSLAGFLNVYWLRRLWGVPIVSFYGVRSNDFRLVRNSVVGTVRKLVRRPRD